MPLGGNSYCRSSEVFDEVVVNARNSGLLGGRIHKKFKFFPPVKGEDSEKYPTVELVVSSIQKKTPLAANYFGKYILHRILEITPDEIRESHEKNLPTVLIIGPGYYLSTITPVLEEAGLDYEIGERKPGTEVDINYGLRLLKSNKESNLGWRILLECIRPDFYDEIILASIIEKVELFELIPKSFIKESLLKAEAFEEEERESDVEKAEVDVDRPTIKLTTYEGAKGLSAQHVFILGLQNSDLPRYPDSISDIEVCRFLVALTRTRKQCHVMATKRFGGKIAHPSKFLDWMGAEYVNYIKIDKNYWKSD